MAVAFSLPAIAKEMRCGWLYNPTPANNWLIDKDGTWTITTQGVPGNLDDKDYDLLAKASAQSAHYVFTNGNYGFSCACLTVTTDKANQSIKSIHQAKQLPLKKCLEDRAINTKIPLDL